MKARWLKAIIYILFLLTSCNIGNRSLDIISFNIRYNNPKDGVNSWDNRKELVFRFIDTESPEVIGFQEVLLDQYNDLKAHLDEYESVAAGRDDGLNGGEMVPIFYKKEEFELISSSHFWLSSTPEVPGSKSWGCHFPRIVSWVQLKNIDNGYIFYVFNTHLSHVSPYARQESAILLLEKIKMLAGKAPVVVTGDFNDNPRSQMYRTLTDNWADHSPLWDSRFESVKPTNPNYNTYNGFRNDTDQVIIDHIFINGMFMVQAFQTYPVKEGNVFISDHNPIKASLTFRLNELRKEGTPKELVQALPEPTFNTDQIAFFDRLTVPISLRDNAGTIYYTTDGSLPDTSSHQYTSPIEIKRTTTFYAYAYSRRKYPSRVVSKTFIKKKKVDLKVISIDPEPAVNYCAESYDCLFDGQHGSTLLDDGSWLGLDARETIITFELGREYYIEDVFLSYLSQPRNGIFSPNAIEVTVAMDTASYQSLGAVPLVPSTDIREDQKYVANIKGQQQKAKFVRLLLKGLPKIPSSLNQDGTPKIFIDEIIIQ